jgi:hypothetical protein
MNGQLLMKAQVCIHPEALTQQSTAFLLHNQEGETLNSKKAISHTHSVVTFSECN